MHAHKEIKIAVSKRPGMIIQKSLTYLLFTYMYYRIYTRFYESGHMSKAKRDRSAKKSRKVVHHKLPVDAK